MQVTFRNFRLFRIALTHVVLNDTPRNARNILSAAEILHNTTKTLDVTFLCISYEQCVKKRKKAEVFDDLKWRAQIGAERLFSNIYYR